MGVIVGMEFVVCGSLSFQLFLVFLVVKGLRMNETMVTNM